MPRLPYVAPVGPVSDRIRERRGGRLTALDGLLLHSANFADGWNSLLSAVRGKSTLPPDIRELTILRVAWRNGADYEWEAHLPVARAAGLGDAGIAALRQEDSDPGPAALSHPQLAALRYTDAMTTSVEVPEEVFRGVAGNFSDREVLELTVTAAVYNMVSRVLVALDVRPDDAPAPAPGGAGRLPPVLGVLP
jgi:4-carboxymuconolactone decarboxylase